MRPFTLSRYSLQNDVVPNAIICQFKICENCGREFVRRASQGTRLVSVGYLSEEKIVTFVDTGRKYCIDCCKSMLLPIDDEDYREMLPDIPTRSKHLIHYDDSLLPITNEKRKTPRLPVAKKRRVSSIRRPNGSSRRVTRH